MLLGLVIVGLLSGSAFCDQVVLNDVVDQLLGSMRGAMQASGSNKLNLPNIDKTFNTKLVGVSIPGTFSAKNGFLEDLSSLHRTGDAVMSTEGNKLKLKASLGFNLLHAYYAQYAFQYLSVSSSGAMEISTTGSAATAAVSVTRSGDQCIVEVDGASLDALGEVKVNLSGSQVLNQFMTMLLNWVTQNFHDTIKNLVNSKLMDALQKGAAKADLCKKLPH